MTARLLETSTTNAFSTTLNGSVTSPDTTITLTTVTGLVAPGVLVIDRVDGNGNATPVLREYVSFTGISGSQITGVTRGVAGSTQQSHSSGAVVEETFSVTHWGDLKDFLEVSHDASGKIVTSSVTTTTARVITHLDLSGASITGNFPINPVWVISGPISGATTTVGKPLSMPQAGQFTFFSAVLRQTTSGVSLLVDINKNNTSIFTDQNTRLLISGGGTYISTASIGTKSFVAGDVFTVDFDFGGGNAADLTILGHAL